MARAELWLVVDVGGGNGSLLGNRCTFVAGSFFESVAHGDAHLLSTILHDWDDHSATRILETARAAGGELLVLDSVIEPGNAPDGAKWLDC